jgi:hypothetical protein
MMTFIAQRGARIMFGLLVFAVMAVSITSRPPKWLSDFDQSFYLTIAYDLDRHGVFSNGMFDDVDSTRSTPQPGMFFGPLYPALVRAAMAVDPRFQDAVRCSVESNHHARDSAQCEVYALPIHLMHALFVAVAVLAIGFAAEAILARRWAFWLAGTLAAIGLLPETELFSYVMTDSVAFSLFSVSAAAWILAWTNGRQSGFVTTGLALGLLCLARPAFQVLLPVMAGLILLRPVLSHGGRKAMWPQLLAFVAAFAIVVGPWLMRNAYSVGKLGLSEEYGAATLVERFAFNTMTARESALAFPYCLPEIGPPVVDRLFGSETMARFEWDQPGSFFDTGRAHRMALVERNGRLDPIIGSLLREEMSENWWRHLLVSIPLAWCGLWVGWIWSLALVPLFAWACALAWRRSQPPLLIYAAPALVMVALHAGIANHYSRYNLGLIGPFAVGGAWVIARTTRKTRMLLAQKQILQTS